MMFVVFCLRLAAGLAFSLLLLPARLVEPRFYRIHLLIALSLAAAGGAMSWLDGVDELFWLALGLGGTGCLVGMVVLAFEGAPGGQAATLLAAAGLVAAAVLRKEPAETASLVWPALDNSSSAALLGIATTAMLMGHWYLIAPTLSIRPLLRLLMGLFLAAGLRLLVAGGGLWLVLADRTITLDAVAWMWLSVRWLAGLVGVAVLGWMAWQAARIRSTQSATGILYVVVIFTFLGELTDQLLQDHLSAVRSSLSLEWTASDGPSTANR